MEARVKKGLPGDAKEIFRECLVRLLQVGGLAIQKRRANDLWKFRA
jgi:hypothetical protein